MHLCSYRIELYEKYSENIKKVLDKQLKKCYIEHMNNCSNDKMRRLK
jgi:hypothetical protein